MVGSKYLFFKYVYRSGNATYRNKNPSRNGSFGSSTHSFRPVMWAVPDTRGTTAG